MMDLLEDLRSAILYKKNLISQQYTNAFVSRMYQLKCVNKYLKLPADSTLTTFISLPSKNCCIFNRKINNLIRDR